MSGTPSKPAAAAANLSLSPPAHGYSTRSRSPSPAPPGSGRSRSRSPTATLTRSMARMQVASPGGNGSAAPGSPRSRAARSSTTALVYDERCLLHQANYAHVEQPARASTTMQLLKSSGVYGRCVHVPSRPARDDELIGQAHTAEHVAKIDGTAQLDYKPAEPDSETEGDDTLYPDCKFLDNDTYVNQHSAAAARLAIGGLVDLCEAVLAGRVRNGFAVIRPPGHHADTVRASGFCLYNNVACAVQALKAKHPELKRFMIVDFDVHHGDGTQSIFYDDPDVLYTSIHRYQHGTFYPKTGAHTDCGGANALGSTVNVPLNYTRMGDHEYLTITKQILAPIAREFQPDMLLISAGFDCAQGDPLGGMEVSSDGFGHITRALMQAVPQHGRVVMALEGGYNVRAVSEGVVSCVRALLGDDLQPLEDPFAFLGKREIAKLQQKRELFLRDMDQVVREQRKYWKCMKQVSMLPPEVAARLEQEAAVAAAAAAAAAATTAAKVPAAAPSAGAPSQDATVAAAPASAPIAAAPAPLAQAPVASLSVASAAEALASLAMAPTPQRNATVASPPKPTGV